MPAPALAGGRRLIASLCVVQLALLFTFEFGPGLLDQFATGGKRAKGAS